MKSKIGLILDVDFKPFNPIDRSVYGHVLTNYGSQWNLNGRQFDGVDDYVSAASGDGNVLNFIAQDYTLMAWIKPQNVTNRRAIISRGNEDLTGWHFFLNVNGSLDLEHDFGVDRRTTSTAGDIANDIWVMVAAVRTGTTAKLYKNGVSLSLSEINTMSNPNSHSGALTIGFNLGNNTDPFNGSIGEVRIWNRALSASEVQQLYLEGRKKGRV